MVADNTRKMATLRASEPHTQSAHPDVHREPMFAPATRTAPPRVCVVAEIGVNHDGRADRAIELVRAAAEAGADAIKLQLFDPKFLLSKEAGLVEYQRSSDDDVVSMLDRLKLSVPEMLSIRAATRQCGLGFVVTPFSLENFPALQVFDPDAVKIASPDVVNLPLLRLAASLSRPMLVSTGAADLGELVPVVEWLRQQKSPDVHRHLSRLCLLQCISSYPIPMDVGSGLGGMAAMADEFGFPVGYSDHTTDLLTGAMAVAAGACVIEKHLTHDQRAMGPDHAASFDPDQFAGYVKRIRQATAMFGRRGKQHHGVEEEVRQICRQSICAKRVLFPGHVLRRDDLTIKRPGTGIPAAQFEQVIGRRLSRAVKADHLLHELDLA